MKLKSNIFLSEKGEGKIAVVNIEDESDSYMVVDGELAVIMKRIFIANEEPEAVLKKYSGEDLGHIREFFNDLKDEGIIDEA